MVSNISKRNKNCKECRTQGGELVGSVGRLDESIVLGILMFFALIWGTIYLL